MIFLRIFGAFLFCFLIAGAAVSQESSAGKKDKKSESKNVKMKANLMILDSNNRFADDVKIEDVKVFENGIEQKITSFAKTPPILNLGIVVDNSGSMRQSLEQIIAQAKTLAANLKQTDEAFVVRFVDRTNISIEQDWTADKAKLNETFENLYTEGGQSAVVDALYLSTEKILEREKKDKSKKYAMVIVSDGEERDSFYKYNEMLALFNNSDVQVFMLSYAADAPLKPKKAAKFADRIVFQTGGIEFNLKRKSSKDEVVAALKSLITELRANYVFTYTSSVPIDQKQDNLARKLTVQIADAANGEKRQAFARENIFIPKD